MPDEKLASAYKLAIEMHNAESQRYWDRNNVFILLNGGFLVLFGIDFIDGVADRLLICVIGFLFSYLWVLVLMRGKDLIERWNKVVRHIEAADGQIPPIFGWSSQFSTEGQNSRLPFSSMSASGLMRAAAVVVSAGWLVGFLILLLSSGWVGAIRWIKC